MGMRISIFTDSFLPYYSGVSCAVINQTNALIGRGHDVDIYRPKPRDDGPTSFDDLDPRAQVFDIPISIPNPRIPDLHIAIPSVLSSYHKVKLACPDLIHVHTEWGCGWEGVLIARLMEVPIVGTFHTFFAEPEYLKHFYIPDFSAAKTLMWKYSVFFYSQCDRLVSPSESVKRELMRNGLTKEPMILSNGVKLPAPGAPPDLTERRKELGLDGPTAIYIGRIAVEKSLEVVIDALARVRESVPNARLALIGSGPVKEDLKARAQRLGLDDAVVWLGFVPHDDLISKRLPLLGDLFITASKTENQPLSILESMAFGLPFVGVRAKGLPELIRHGENGLLAEPDNVDALADAWREVLMNRERRESMGKASIELSKQHGIEDVGRRLEALYEEVLQTPESGS